MFGHHIEAGTDLAAYLAAVAQDLMARSHALVSVDDVSTCLVHDFASLVAHENRDRVHLASVSLGRPWVIPSWLGWLVGRPSL